MCIADSEFASISHSCVLHSMFALFWRTQFLDCSKYILSKLFFFLRMILGMFSDLWEKKKHSDSEFKVLNEERLFFAKSQIKFIIS